MAMDQAPATVTASFEALYRSSADAVYAYAASLLRDRSAAEEVTASRLRARLPQAALLRSAPRDPARLALRDRPQRGAGRAAPAQAQRGALQEPADDEAAPEGEAEAAERRATVRAALATLEPRDRELIALKFHAGLNNAEIADVLGVSPSNAGTRVHRALTRLREACHAPS